MTKSEFIYSTYYEPDYKHFIGVLISHLQNGSGMFSCSPMTAEFTISTTQMPNHRWTREHTGTVLQTGYEHFNEVLIVWFIVRRVDKFTFCHKSVYNVHYRNIKIFPQNLHQTLRSRWSRFGHLCRGDGELGRRQRTLEHTRTLLQTGFQRFPRVHEGNRCASKFCWRRSGLRFAVWQTLTSGPIVMEADEEVRQAVILL